MISIAMATYNGEKFLNEQLDSILNQSYSDFELNICDDCSKDLTPEILNKYAEKDKRIHIFLNDKNLGFKKNFEKAVSFSHGDYIAFADQDDIWTEDHLQTLLDGISGRDLCCGNAALIHSDGTAMNLTTKECLSNFILPNETEKQFKNLLYANFAQGTAMMITKKLSEKMFPLPEVTTYHDWWAALIASINNGCSYTDKNILLYRQHGKNVTTTKAWHFFDAINDTIKQRKLLHIEYENKINQAKLLATFTSNKTNLQDIDECISYYSFLLQNRRWKAYPFFKKNYESIYWVRKPTKKHYFARFVKIFLLHI